MNRLRVYTVHVNPTHPNSYEDAKFIEEGFNWKAFLFSGLWTLRHALWWPTVLIILINGAIISLAIIGTPGGLGCMFIAWNTIIGFLGNDWRRNKLKSQGYIVADIVTGDSLLRAEQRFFDRYFLSREDAQSFAS